jgi:hypothetical protein
MSVSTNAMLFYGFTFAENDEEPPWYTDEYEDEWEKYYVTQKGVLYPSGDASLGVINDYWAMWNKIIAECPCSIGIHGHSDYQHLFVYAKDHYYKARRGYPQMVPSLKADTKSLDQLYQFCKLMGIKWQEPYWYLVSYSDF